jgi:hypothetical protein
VFHACGFCRMCGHSIATRNFVSAVYQEKPVGALERRSKGIAIGEVAGAYVDAVVVAGSCFGGVTHENSRTVAAPKKKFNDTGTDVSGSAGDQINHGKSFLLL